jgi:drug/metabolite transporter (DMT)-like permease
MNTALHSESRALILALSAVLLWSTVATAFKIALASCSPQWLLAGSCLVSWLFLSLVVLMRRQSRQVLQSLRQHWRHHVRQGLLNPLLYYLILFQAYDRLPAQQAQAINYTWALSMSLLAVPLLGQKLARRDLVALLMAYGGVVVIASGGSPENLLNGDLSGVLLALLSTLVWALYWILNTRLQQDALTGLWNGFLVATPLTFLVACWSQGIIDISTVSWQSATAVVYVGLFEMGVTFLLWQQAMNLTRRTAAISSLIFLSPFLSLLFISQILGEAIATTTLAGLVLIIVGLLIQKLPAGLLRKHKQPASKPESQ